MFTKILRTWVHAQLETIWGALMDSVGNPQKYMPDLEAYRILEEAEGAIFREMKIRDTLYKEKISVNSVSKEICRELLDHPIYSGRIIIKAVPCSVQNPMAPVDLQFFLELEPKFSQTDLSEKEKGENRMVTILEEEQLRLKEVSEELEKTA